MLITWEHWTERVDFACSTQGRTQGCGRSHQMRNRRMRTFLIHLHGKKNAELLDSNLQDLKDFEVLLFDDIITHRWLRVHPSWTHARTGAALNH
jgi:hypothetical protein